MKRTRRKPRKVRRRILILCEGLTEKNYFQAIKEDPDFKQALLAVHPQVIAAKNPTPEQVVRETSKRAKEAEKDGNPYEQIWVVFDHDNHAHRKTAFDQAQKNSFSIAFSAIAFEIWYLLHFVKSAKAFLNAESLIRELRKYYPDYQKAKQNDFTNLKDKLSIAFENTNWLKDRVKDQNKHLTDHNPWTDVDVLVNELIQPDT